MRLIGLESEGNDLDLRVEEREREKKEGETEKYYCQISKVQKGD